MNPSTLSSEIVSDFPTSLCLSNYILQYFSLHFLFCMVGKSYGRTLKLEGL